MEVYACAGMNAVGCSNSITVGAGKDKKKERCPHVFFVPIDMEELAVIKNGTPKVVALECPRCGHAAVYEFVRHPWITIGVQQ